MLKELELIKKDIELIDQTNKRQTISLMRIEEIIEKDLYLYDSGNWLRPLLKKLNLALKEKYSGNAIYLISQNNKTKGSNYSVILSAEERDKKIKPIITITNGKDMSVTYLQRDKIIAIDQLGQLTDSTLNEYLQEELTEVMKTAEKYFGKYQTVINVTSTEDKSNVGLNFKNKDSEIFNGFTCYTLDGIKIGTTSLTNNKRLLITLGSEAVEHANVDKENLVAYVDELPKQLRNIVSSYQKDNFRNTPKTYSVKRLQEEIENELKCYQNGEWIMPLYNKMAEFVTLNRSKATRIKPPKDNKKRKELKEWETLFKRNNTQFVLRQNPDSVNLSPQLTISSYADFMKYFLLEFKKDDIVESCDGFFDKEILDIFEKSEYLMSKYGVAIKAVFKPNSSQKFSVVFEEKTEYDFCDTIKDRTIEITKNENIALKLIPELLDLVVSDCEEVEVDKTTNRLRNIININSKNKIEEQPSVQDKISIYNQIDAVNDYRVSTDNLYWAIEEMNTNLRKPKEIAKLIEDSSDEIEDIHYHVSKEGEVKVELVLEDNSIISVTSNEIDTRTLPTLMEINKHHIKNIFNIMSEIKSIYGFEIIDGKINMNQYKKQFDQNYKDITEEIESFDDATELGVDELSKSELLIKKGELARFKDRLKKDEGFELATIEDGIFKVKLVFTDDIEIDTIITPNPAMLEGHVMEEDKINNYIKDHKKEILQGLKITSDRMVKELSPTKIKLNDKKSSN